MVAQLQARMLSGDQEARRFAIFIQGMGDGSQLDGFRTRTDYERDTILAQLSPWLRPGICRLTRQGWQERI